MGGAMFSLPVPIVMQTDPSICYVYIPDNATNALLDLGTRSLCCTVKQFNSSALVQDLSTYQYYFHLKYVFGVNPNTLVHGYCYEYPTYIRTIRSQYNNINIYSTYNTITQIYDNSNEEMNYNIINGHYSINFLMENGIDRLSFKDCTLTVSLLIHNSDYYQKSIKMGLYNSHIYIWRPDEQVKTNMIIIKGGLPKIDLHQQTFSNNDFNFGASDIRSRRVDPLNHFINGAQEILEPPAISWKDEPPTRWDKAYMARYIQADSTDIDHYILVIDGQKGPVKFYDPHSLTQREGYRFDRLKDITVTRKQKSTLHVFTKHPISTVIDLKSEKLFQ